MPAFDQLGAALRSLRTSAAVSQRKLEERARLGASSISRYENGETPSLPTLQAILGGLDCSLYDLATALDEANGIGPAQRVGRPNARWVALLADRALDHAWLSGLAAALVAVGDQQAREDFVASVVSVAETRARSALAELDAHAAAVAEKPALPEPPVSQTVQPKKKGKT